MPVQTEETDFSTLRDNEIDDLIVEKVYGVQLDSSGQAPAIDEEGNMPEGIHGSGGGKRGLPREFTQSIDLALAAVQKAKCSFILDSDKIFAHGCRIYGKAWVPSRFNFPDSLKDLPRAVCEALLRQLDNEEAPAE